MSRLVGHDYRRMAVAYTWLSPYGDIIITTGESIPDCIERARNRYGVTFTGRDQSYDRRGYVTESYQFVEDSDSQESTLREYLCCLNRDVTVTIKGSPDIEGPVIEMLHGLDKYNPNLLDRIVHHVVVSGTTRTITLVSRSDFTGGSNG